jgi:hypothetical protein
VRYFTCDNEEDSGFWTENRMLKNMLGLGGRLKNNA